MKFCPLIKAECKAVKCEFWIEYDEELGRCSIPTISTNLEDIDTEIHDISESLDSIYHALKDLSKDKEEL